MNNSEICILLMCGGDSPERDVSIDTGKSVFAALKQLGFRVFVSDPLHPEIRPTEDPRVFFDNSAISKDPPKIGEKVYQARRKFIDILGHHLNLSCDLVFNGLHGGVGEDGTMQSVLDYIGVTYTGSGARASQVAMSKDMSKRIVASVGVPVAKHVLIDTPPHEKLVADKGVLEGLSLPVVVKPDHEGSSVGVTIVQTLDELDDAVKAAKAFGGSYMIERFIPGREVTVAVMDDRELPVIEICPKDGFYDYVNKYQSGSCEYKCPAPVDDAITRKLEQMARAAYRAIGLRNYARIDFRLDEDGTPYFLEANTLPGLTTNSLFPKAARTAGLDYPEMISTIVGLSMRNRRA